MPGFAVLTTQLAKSGLICPECSLLVKEAVQTPDGVRLCKSCYDELARYQYYENTHAQKFCRNYAIFAL